MGLNREEIARGLERYYQPMFGGTIRVRFDEKKRQYRIKTALGDEFLVTAAKARALIEKAPALQVAKPLDFFYLPCRKCGAGTPLTLRDNTRGWSCCVCHFPYRGSGEPERDCNARLDAFDKNEGW